MTTAIYTASDTGHNTPGAVHYPPTTTVAHESAVSWGAVAAGATAAAALSLILLVLGVGLGLSVVSPWGGQGISAVPFGTSTIVWLAFTQLAASGLGGYIAGRLRRVWTGVHHDEMYFRDTVHGLLSWAVATLVTAALLGSAVASAIGTGAQAGAAVAGGAATVAAAGAAAAAPAAFNGSQREVTQDNMRYYVDALFRSATAAAAVPAAVASEAGGSAGATMAPPQPTAPVAPDSALTQESTRILANAVRGGALPADDASYLAQAVAQRTGMGQADAQKRVADTFNRVQAQRTAVETMAKEQADKARKASAHAALWIFVSLLFGAFVASLFATIGSRQRFAL